MLTDAGPLIALFNDQDQYHALAYRFVEDYGEKPLTTLCPCLTEAMQLLGKKKGWLYQQKLACMIRKGKLTALHLQPKEELRALELMKQYRDRPMSFADAPLIAVAETRGETQIFTFDSDFRFYRLANGSVLETLP